MEIRFGLYSLYICLYKNFIDTNYNVLKKGIDIFNLFSLHIFKKCAKRIHSISDVLIFSDVVSSDTSFVSVIGFFLTTTSSLT
jgi:hypothetical protein